jgi:NAD(P)-dependent dehydrogenase (short-subunit alcohol dehydrogenase family)
MSSSRTECQFAVRFKGKSALVCGAGGGIGLATANQLLAAGINVALADIKDQPVDIANSAGQATYYQGDLSDEAFVSQLAADVAAAQGGIDYLVNTTGVLWFDRDRSVLEMDMDTWDRVFQINLKSFALSVRHVAAHMRTRGGGAMVHIASIDALRGDGKPQDAYGAAKAGVIRLSKSLAIQLAPDAIRSNTILPGPVRSPMQARWADDPEGLAALSAHIPLGRVGSADDIAGACLFLLSDAAAFITGTELIVDGGCTARP